jgi:hypothetical protein
MIQINKRNTILILLILLTAIIFSGCGLSYSFHSATNMLRKEDAKEFTVDKEVVELITELDINTSIADIELIPADHYYVEIHYTYWADAPEYTLKDGRLYFDDSKSFPNSYSINYDLDNVIQIYLPENTDFSRITLNNASGNVSAEGFHTENLDVKVAYGDLMIADASAMNADINLASGSSQIENFAAEEIDFNNAYGNAEFVSINTKTKLPEGLTPDNLNINMSSGKVTLNDLSFPTIKISNSYGDVSCDKLTATDCNLKLSSGDLKVNSSDINTIKVNNSYGDVIMKLPGPAEDYSLDLKTSYGGITVGNKRYDERINLENSGSKYIEADLSSGDVDIQFEN